ncbi:MAG: hypothetical protein Q9159_000456 [Coniocarpon cinnabarinum]
MAATYALLESSSPTTYLVTVAPPLPQPTSTPQSAMAQLQSLQTTLRLAHNSYNNEVHSVQAAGAALARANDTRGKQDQPLWAWQLPTENWWMPRLGPKKSALDELAKAVKAQVADILWEVEGMQGVAVKAEECRMLGKEIRKLVKEVLG